MRRESPSVLLLDGGSFITLSIARELSEDLGATIIGVGTSKYSRLLRSKYCDIGVIAPPVSDDRYVESIQKLIDIYQPDCLLPVGYGSWKTIEAARSELPSYTTTCLPPSKSFHTAIDDLATSAHAENVGIQTPAEYSDIVRDLDKEGRPAGCLTQLEFPLFLKPRWEVDDGHVTTARVDHPDTFWEIYDQITDNAAENEILVQECIDGSPSTYGCGLLFLDNKVELLFSHEELRSVPRRGGSGTHLRILREPYLESKSIELLRDIGWHGIVLVEYKKRSDGTFVLMEINPKFWASYALASTHGYRFASTLVSRVLDLDVDYPLGESNSVGEMVFPLRELYHYAQHHGDEHLLECLTPIIKPGVAWSIDLSDLRAWLTPPTSLLGMLPEAESAVNVEILVQSHPRTSRNLPEQ